MSFDLIETTVANALFLRASYDNEPAHIAVTPIAELKEYDEQLRSTITLIELLSEPLGRYQLKAFLRVKNAHRRIDFIENVLEFQERLPSLRKSKANYIFSEILLRAVVQLSPEAHQYLDLDAWNRLEFKEHHDSDDNDSVNDDGPSPVSDDSKVSNVANVMMSSKDLNFTMRRSKRESKVDFKVGENVLDLGVDEEEVVDIFNLYVEMMQAGKIVEADFFDELLEKINSLVQEHDFVAFLQSVEWDLFVQLRHYCETTPVNYDSFEIFRVLGKGAFGEVHAVRKKDSKKIYAMKEMNKKKVKYYQSEKMCLLEKNVLKHLDTPYAVNLKYSFHNDESLFLIMDIAQGGDLQYHLTESEFYCFSENRTRFYASELVFALENLHNLGYVYRDLKPGNVLIDEDGHVLLTDFGLVHRLSPNRELTSLAGTAGYWAPEVMMRHPQTKAIDWWSFGVFIHKLLTGHRPKCHCSKKGKEWCPFGSRDTHEQYAKEGVPMSFHLDLDEGKFSAEAVDLMRQLMEPDVEKRLGSNGSVEIKTHPFFATVNWEKMSRREVKPPFKPRKGEVNAATIGEIGDHDPKEAKYRNVKINSENDILFYDRFHHISQRAFQEEIVWSLERNEREKKKQAERQLEKIQQGKMNRGCCTLQ